MEFITNDYDPGTSRQVSPIMACATYYQSVLNMVIVSRIGNVAERLELPDQISQMLVDIFKHQLVCVIYGFQSARQWQCRSTAGIQVRQPVKPADPSIKLYLIFSWQSPYQASR